MLLEQIASETQPKQKVYSVQEALLRVRESRNWPTEQQPYDWCLQNDEGHCICRETGFLNLQDNA